MARTWDEAGIEVPYGRVSGRFVTTCPKCSGERQPAHQRRRCLTVDMDDQWWHCNHCGWKGKIMVDGIVVPNRNRVYKVPEAPVRIKIPEAYEFVEKRGIPAELCREYGIVPTRQFIVETNQEEDCLAFPYLRDGKLVNIKYRTISDKHFQLSGGSEKIFYGLDDCKDARVIVICEGEFDKLAIRVAGHKECLSVPAGGTKGKINLDYLPSGEQILRNANRVVIATDQDEVGDNLARELARCIGPEKCWRARFPDGCKDANEVLLLHGPEELYSCLAYARPFPIAGIHHVEDIGDEVDNLYLHGQTPGLEVGIAALENKLRITPGQFIVFHGTPGSGKSNLVNNIVVNMAKNYGWVVAMFSPEFGNSARLTSNLVPKYNGLPFWDGPTPRMTWEELQEAKMWLGEHFAYIVPHPPTVDSILDMGLILLRRMGISCLVADPWNTIESSGPRGENRSEYIGKCLLKLQEFGRHHGVTIILTAHPRKLPTQTGARVIPEPYDIADSHTFYDRADLIVAVARDMNETTVDIQKVRFQPECGSLGRTVLTYNPVNGTYE